MFVRNGIFASVGISCLDLNDEAFGKAFNIKPVAICNLPEPSNTCKALREMFLDFKTAGEYEILLSRGTRRDDDVYIYKAFNCAMWVDGATRYFLMLSKLMLLLLSFSSLVIVCDVGVASTNVVVVAVACVVADVGTIAAIDVVVLGGVVAAVVVVDDANTDDGYVIAPIVVLIDVDVADVVAIVILVVLLLLFLIQSQSMVTGLK